MSGIQNMVTAQVCMNYALVKHRSVVAMFDLENDAPHYAFDDARTKAEKSPPM